MLAGNDPNLFVVGDEDQSIYSFNGSCPEELYNFEKTYPGAKIFKIETNYRSTSKIIDFSQKFINNSKYSRVMKNMISNRKAGNSVKGYVVADMPSQAESIVRRLLSENVEDTAILYRENSTGIVMAYHLMKNSIPFHFARDDISMFNTGSFRKVINFMKLLNDPRDVEALMMIYYDIDEDISIDMIYKMYHLVREQPETNVFDHLENYANNYLESYHSYKFDNLNQEEINSF